MGTFQSRPLLHFWACQSAIPDLAFDIPSTHAQSFQLRRHNSQHFKKRLALIQCLWYFQPSLDHFFCHCTPCLWARSSATSALALKRAGMVKFGALLNQRHQFFPDFFQSENSLFMFHFFRPTPVTWPHYGCDLFDLAP
jgi:hypothetical protein